MNVKDYYQQGKRWWLRLHEKGGKFHEVPAHHNAEEYLDAAGIGNQKGAPLWRSMSRERTFSENRMSRVDVFRMIKRRVRQASDEDHSELTEKEEAAPLFSEFADCAPIFNSHL